MHRPRKIGLGTAYFDALAMALATGHDIVVERDSDGSYLPEDRGALIDAMDPRTELLFGTRWTDGSSVRSCA